MNYDYDPKRINDYLRRLNPTDFLVGFTSLAVEGNMYEDDCQFDEGALETIISICEDDVLVKLFSSFQSSIIGNIEEYHYLYLFSSIINSLFHIIMYRPHLLPSIRPHLNSSILMGRIEGLITKNENYEGNLQSFLFSIGEQLNDTVSYTIRTMVDSLVMTDIYNHFDGVLEIEEEYSEDDIKFMYESMKKFAYVLMRIFVESAYFVVTSCSPYRYMNDIINEGVMYLVDEFRYLSKELMPLVCKTVDLDLFNEYTGEEGVMPKRPTIYDLCMSALEEMGFTLKGESLYKQSNSRKGEYEIWVN